MFKLQSCNDRESQLQHGKRSEILLVKIKSQRARYATWTHDPQIKVIPQYYIAPSYCARFSRH